MGRRNQRKRTLKTKRVESFVDRFEMTPQEFLSRLNSLPNQIRTKQNIREARDLT